MHVSDPGVHREDNIIKGHQIGREEVPSGPGQHSISILLEIQTQLDPLERNREKGPPVRRFQFRRT